MAYGNKKYNQKFFFASKISAPEKWKFSTKISMPVDQNNTISEIRSWFRGMPVPYLDVYYRGT